tara:strand:+ start:493 stop:1071 length:579 start_codon:yes stop_codon:yes gene_type:complete
MEISVVVFISYICGSIPFGLILTKSFLKKDIRNVGSGNIGATNVLRGGNKFLGYLTLLLDIMKAAIPVLYFKNNVPEFVYISGLSVIIGHIFPIWLKFKGGKGVATYLGILLVLNYNLAIIFVFIWVLSILTTKISSLSSIISITVILIYILVNNTETSIYFFLITSVLIYFNHKENIKRILDKSEKKIKIF